MSLPLPLSGDSQRSSATESFGGSEVQENAVTTTVAPSEEKAEGNGEGAGVPSGEQKVLGNLEGLPGWSRVLDTASGNIYFWNENTNEVLPSPFPSTLIPQTAPLLDFPVALDSPSLVLRRQVLWDNPLEAAAEPQADAGGSKPTSSAELEGAVSNSLTAIAVATGDLDAIMKAPCEEASILLWRRCPVLSPPPTDH